MLICGKIIFLQEKCGCLPWFLIGKMEGLEESALCERYGNSCFRRVVVRRNEDDDEDRHCKEKCLPDCERTEYTWSSSL